MSQNGTRPSHSFPPLLPPPPETPPLPPVLLVHIPAPPEYSGTSCPLMPPPRLFWPATSPSSPPPLAILPGNTAGEHGSACADHPKTQRKRAEQLQIPEASPAAAAAAPPSHPLPDASRAGVLACGGYDWHVVGGVDAFPLEAALPVGAGQVVFGWGPSLLEGDVSERSAPRAHHLSGFFLGGVRWLAACVARFDFVRWAHEVVWEDLCFV